MEKVQFSCPLPSFWQIGNIEFKIHSTPPWDNNQGTGTTTKEEEQDSEVVAVMVVADGDGGSLEDIDLQSSSFGAGNRAGVADTPRIAMDKGDR